MAHSFSVVICSSCTVVRVRVRVRVEYQALLSTSINFSAQKNASTQPTNTHTHTHTPVSFVQTVDVSLKRFVWCWKSSLNSSQSYRRCAQCMCGVCAQCMCGVCACARGCTFNVTTTFNSSRQHVVSQGLPLSSVKHRTQSELWSRCVCVPLS